MRRPIIFCPFRLRPPTAGFTKNRCYRRGSCVYYLTEKGYRPTVFEENERPGGMLVYGVPSYRLEKEVAEALEEGVSLNCDWRLKEILTSNGKVVRVVFKRCASVLDDRGAFPRFTMRRRRLRFPVRMCSSASGRAFSGATCLRVPV